MTLRRESRGFTLLEVMLALGIVAIAGLMIYENQANLFNQQRTLENKTLAIWLVQNELNRHRIASAADPDSPLVALYAGSGGFESFGGIDWRIDVETEPSAMHPNVRWRIVEARVRDAASQDPLARLETLEWSQ